MTLHHFTSSCSDLYEFVLRGHVISRITRYANGTHKRSDMQYDECPEDVKVAVLKEVEKQLCFEEQE